ncbi:MAG TPA: hypothetical protein VF832_05495 [Longimicrobiales bacterium]
MKWTTALVLSLLTPGLAPETARAQWTAQASGTGAELRALAAVSARVAWAAGKGGIFVRTLDGGLTWRADSVPGAGGLFFIGVAATGGDTAWLAGSSFADSLPDARLYRTVDGGRSWTQQWRSTRPGIFLDGVRCWDGRRAVAFGDALDGHMVVLVTADGGATWSPPSVLPAAPPGEAGFAASGTALEVGAAGRAWLVTGGGGGASSTRARVHRTVDYGRSWSVVQTSLAAAKTAGLFGVAFRDAKHGLAVGGEYTQPRAPGAKVLATSDGGRSWRLVGEAAPTGVRYGVAWPAASGRGAFAVAVGPTGSGYTVDGGRSWTVLDTVAYNTVAFVRGSSGPVGWAAGPAGKIARWTGLGSAGGVLSGRGAGAGRARR